MAEDNNPAIQQELEAKFDLSEVDLIKLEPDLVIIEEDDSVDDGDETPESGQPPTKRVRCATEPQEVGEVVSGEDEEVQRQTGAGSSRIRGWEVNMLQLQQQELQRQLALGVKIYPATFYKQEFFCYQTGPGNFVKFYIQQAEQDGLPGFKMYLQQANFNNHLVNNSVVFERHASGLSLIHI